RAVVEWISEVRPDLVALQEVVRTSQLCQASWIAEKTGMSPVFGAAGSYSGAEFGNAVLSRFPVLGSRCRRLHEGSDGDAPRAIVTADVEADGQRVSFSSTHLSYRFDDGWARQEQVREIADFVSADSADYPLIVCGDFNAEPAATEVRFIKGLHALDGQSFHLFDAFEVAHPGEFGYTWSNANPFAAEEREPDRRIDYIFVGVRGDDGGGQILDAKVVCDQPRAGVWPSDHFGVAAVLSCPSC
ncbi:MAG TPA: endonuclease/exonuclease/phosphatase family protein, partial [Candidatus Tumulicola sp.]|nr:endonuclease/exonuclease/phosphatase family protein [Candidatus Tumulicola sp.]